MDEKVDWLVIVVNGVVWCEGVNGPLFPSMAVTLMAAPLPSIFTRRPPTPDRAATALQHCNLRKRQ